MDIAKHKIKPISFLFLVLSLFCTHFYLFRESNFLINLHGKHQEWPLLIDILITIPLMYWLIFRPTLKQLLIKSTIFFSLGVFIGSLIIPDESQQLWSSLSSLRYLLIAAFIVAELTLLTSLIHIISKLSSNEIDIETKLNTFLNKRRFSATIKELYILEARIWLYALFSRKKQFQFKGDKHFSYANYNGNASNQQGFLFIILFELPIVHFILHFAWSPIAVNWITGLTLYGLIFMYADYKATLIRPISITSNNLIIRYGVWGNLTVPLHSIESIHINSAPIKRSKNHLRFCQFGSPNICITLKPNTSLQTAFGINTKEKIYLGVDNPTSFIKELTNG